MTKIDFDDTDEEKQDKIAAEMLVHDSCCTCGRSQISEVHLPYKDYRRGEKEDRSCGG